jgi:hypothetical protein
MRWFSLQFIYERVEESLRKPIKFIYYILPFHKARTEDISLKLDVCKPLNGAGNE